MDLVNVLHMNADNRNCSYASNSSVQKNVITKSRKFLEDTIDDYSTRGFSQCFNLADLGCSSGPNTFLAVENIVNSIHAVCQRKNLKAPDEFQAFLNDLPNNDFNTVFRMTASFDLKIRIEEGHEKCVNCFVCGVPGSFYTRLFPSKSLHFVHSSFCVHWLSQVPPNLLDNNKKSIYIAKTSPPGVYEAYFNQFKTDLTTFLSMRSEEIIPDGRMVLTLLGRSIADPTSKDCCYIYELLANSLYDIFTEGLLREEDINSFNLPLYTPCVNELVAVIESEGSFGVDKIETMEVEWDVRDQQEIVNSEENSGKYTAKTVRAVMEPLLARHFGNTYMDKIFERLAVHVNEHLSKEKTNHFNILVSLTRK